MGKRLTQEEAVQKCINTHGDKYDYSLMKYEGSTSKIEIICQEHGAFWQQYNSHVNSNIECPKCSTKKSARTRTRTISQVIASARLVHGYTYNYINAIYTSSRDKMEITCQYHGSFWQTPNDHIHNKAGCPKCGNIRISQALSFSLDENIKRSKEIHNNKYDYSNIKDYNNMTEKVLIKCNNCGLLFNQSFRSHIHAQNGCPICYTNIISEKKRLTQEEYIQRVTTLYGHKYDYSDVKYIKLHDYILINCKNCKQQFSQKANNHLNGHGCKHCNPGGVFLSKDIFKTRPELKDIQSILYLVQFSNTEEEFCKLGISVNTVNKRFGIKYNNYNITQIKTITMPLYEAWEAEQSLLKQLKKYRYIPKTKFGGYTECFTLDIKDILITD